MSLKEVVQKLGLNTDNYSAGLKRINTQVKQTTNDINAALVNSAKSFGVNEQSIMQWGSKAAKVFDSARKSFNENVTLGMKTTALAAGAQALNNAGTAAIDMGFKFSKTFADVASMSNANEKQLKQWRDVILDVGSKTGANLGELSTSFANVFTSAKPEDMEAITRIFGEMSQMTDGKSMETAAAAMKTLQEQGKEFNPKNFREFAEAANILRKNSANIPGGMSGAIGAMASMSGEDVKNSGLSDRERANLMGGATRVSGVSSKDGLDVISKLINLSSNKMIQGSVLSGIMGGKDFMNNGKFDISRLTGEGARKNLMNLGKDDSQRKEVFGSMTSTMGFSREQSDALYKMAMNGEDFASKIKQAADDTTTFSESAKKSGNNLETSWDKMINGMVKGFTQMFGSLEGAAKDLFSGNFLEAAKKGFSAIPDVLSGIMDNKALAGGAIASMWAGGAGLQSVAGMLGLGGTAASGGTAAAGSGIAAQAAIAAATGTGSVGALAAGGAGGMALLGGGVLAAGAGGYAIGSGINYGINKYGSDENGNNPVTKAIGLGAVATGNMSATEFKDMFGKQGEVMEKLLQILSSDTPIKVGLESKDPLFSLVPKATDNQRDAGTR